MLHTQPLGFLGFRDKDSVGTPALGQCQALAVHYK